MSDVAMTKPNYDDFALDATITATVEGRDYTVGLHLPTDTKKASLSEKERGRIKGCFENAVKFALAEWRQGLARGGLENPDPPYEALIQRLLPRGYELDDRASFAPEKDLWNEYKVWLPADEAWFARCFGKPFEEFNHYEQHWIRNRIIALIFSLCFSRHNLMMSTGSSSTFGVARDWQDPSYRNRSNAQRDIGDGAINPGSSVPHLCAYQRRNILELLGGRLQADRATTKKLIYMKRAALSQNKDDDGFSKDFTQTLIHEYSHNYAYTCDYWYIADFSGAIRGYVAADYEKYKKKDDLPDNQKVILRRGKTKFQPEMMIANADHVASYLCRYITPMTAISKLGYPVTEA